MNNPLNIVEQRRELFKFVKAEEVRMRCGVQANINDDNFEIPTQTAQDTIIRPILGKTLYDKLKTEFITANYDYTRLPDSTTTVDGIDYKTLYEQIYLPLVWHSYCKALFKLAYKVSEKGIMANNSDYAENVGLEIYGKLYETEIKIAQFYTDDLNKYICDTFKTDQAVQQESKKEGGYSSAIFFGSYRKTDK